MTGQGARLPLSPSHVLLGSLCQHPYLDPVCSIEIAYGCTRESILSWAREGGCVAASQERAWINDGSSRL